MKVTLDISKEFYEFAKGQAELFGYRDTETYLTGMLNIVLLTAKNEFEENGPLRLPMEAGEAERAFFAAFEEDPGGGLRLKDEGDDDDDDDHHHGPDLDDGIPH